MMKAALLLCLMLTAGAVIVSAASFNSSSSSTESSSSSSSSSSSMSSSSSSFSSSSSSSSPSESSSSMSFNSSSSLSSDDTSSSFSSSSSASSSTSSSSSSSSSSSESSPIGSGVTCPSPSATLEIGSVVDGDTRSGQYLTPSNFVCDIIYLNSSVVVYSLVGNGEVIALETDANFDTKIFVFADGCNTCIGGNDDVSFGVTSYYELNSELGVTYTVIVTGYWPLSNGPFQLGVDADPSFTMSSTSSSSVNVGVTCPASEGVLEIPSTTFGNLNGQPKLQPPTFWCDSVYYPNNTVSVYTLVGDGDVVTLETCSPQFDSMIIVLSEDCSLCVTADDDGADYGNCGPLAAYLEFTTVADQVYTVIITGYLGNNDGPFSIVVNGGGSGPSVPDFESETSSYTSIDTSIDESGSTSMMLNAFSFSALIAVVTLVA